MSDEDYRLTFIGGPWDGDEVDGLFAKVLAYYEPPYFCVAADGRFEHYSRETRNEFHHDGPCLTLFDHPDCGHDHTDV